MCGIAGWIDHSQDMSEKIDLLNRMSETLDRRGPDENATTSIGKSFDTAVTALQTSVSIKNGF